MKNLCSISFETLINWFQVKPVRHESHTVRSCLVNCQRDDWRSFFTVTVRCHPTAVASRVCVVNSFLFSSSKKLWHPHTDSKIFTQLLCVIKKKTGMTSCNWTSTLWEEHVHLGLLLHYKGCCLVAVMAAVWSLLDTEEILWGREDTKSYRSPWPESNVGI